MLSQHLALTLQAGGRIQEGDPLMNQDWLLLYNEKTYRVRPIRELPAEGKVEVFFLDTPEYEYMTGGI